MLSYCTLIRESKKELQQLEKKQVNGYCRDRVRFLRLLKTGQARTQVSAGRQIGLKARQSQRLWQLYKQAGLAALISVPHRGYQGRLSPEQVEKLKERLRQDGIASLRDAQQVLSSDFQGVFYLVFGGF